MPNKTQNKQFWQFKNISDEEAELRISGEIIDDDWVWLYEWFGEPHASANAFRLELAKFKGKNIKVWIDSPGGSIFAGMGMFNALMEHKKTGATVETIGEKVMSAAGLPYMAGDNKTITLGGMFMMHNPLPGDRVYGYADDLRKYADILDEFKEAIINIYQQGTGLDRKVISDMMDSETYMSAHNAVKNGFADSVLYGDEQKDDIKNKNVELGFMFNRLAIQNCVDNSMSASTKKFLELAQLQAQGEQPEKPVENKQLKEETSVEIKNTEDLRKAYPELTNQLATEARAQGAKNERERIREIEAISKNIAPELVVKAKFDDPVDAKELAFQALQADSGLAKSYLENALEDSKNSGVDSVKAQAQTRGEGDKPDSLEDRFKNVSARLDARRRGVN